MGLANENSNEAGILDRIRRFNTSLDRLMRLYTGDSVESSEFARIVTKEAAALLGTDRVSAWSLSDDQSCIECIDLYQSASGEHSDGITLYRKDFPRYFDAVLADRVISANEASLDPRTAEFTDVYLKPNRIISMLDAQIRSAGGPRGVICIETVDVYRAWSPDEIAYSVSLAELLGFSMDREDRRIVLSQLEDTNRKLADAVATANEATERYDLAMQAAFEGVWDCDLVAEKVYFADQNFTLLGESYDTPPTEFDWWKNRVHPEDLPDVMRKFRRHLVHDAPYQAMYRIKHKSGDWLWWRSRGKAVRDATGKAIRVVGTNSDVTTLVEAQNELEDRNHQLMIAQKEIENTALHDALTELPNRRHLDQVCGNILRAASENNQLLSVLHIDLDFFKDVNDKFGHAVGDEALKCTAQYLGKLITDGDFVARIGGDEFMAILFDTETSERAVEFCDKLHMFLDQPIVFDSYSFEIGASIGIAKSEPGITDIWHLLGNADLALYEAKNGGRNTYQMFSEDMRVRAALVRSAKEDLRQALSNDQEFIPFFQPQFCAETLKLAGVEALARWKHPERGILPPNEFLALANDMNWVGEIDRQILVRSIDAMRAWQASGLFIPRISVNVSAQRLLDPNLIANVEEFGDDAKFLSFELLESTFLDDTNAAIRAALERLSDLGVEFEIDDFGSGYASILSLVNVRPSRLKIDRSLVASVDTDDAISSLLQSVVDIARTLNIKVVAEGVERKTQLEHLRLIGCDFLQGYGLAKPMSAETVFQTFGQSKPQFDMMAG